MDQADPVELVRDGGRDERAGPVVQVALSYDADTRQIRPSSASFQ